MSRPWIHNLCAFRSKKSPAARRVILNLETFEDRAVPAAITSTWTGATSTNWNVASNWDTGFVPGSAGHTTDIAVIVNHSNNPTLSTAGLSVGGLQINSGTFTLNANLTDTGDFSQSGGTARIAVGNTLTIDGNFSRTGGSFGATGTVVFAGTASQTVSTGTASLPNFTVGNTGGAVTVSNSTLSVAALSVTGSGSLALNNTSLNATSVSVSVNGVLSVADGVSQLADSGGFTDNGLLVLAVNAPGNAAAPVSLPTGTLTLSSTSKFNLTIGALTNPASYNFIAYNRLVGDSTAITYTLADSNPSFAGFSPTFAPTVDKTATGMTVSVTPAPTTVVAYATVGLAGTSVAIGTGAGSEVYFADANAFAAIQTAIDNVSGGGTVDVLAGQYNETAVNRVVPGGGVWTFGLFVDPSHSGLTLRGEDPTTGQAIDVNTYAGSLAQITTHAYNDFGPAGVFVYGDNVTISGLEFVKNTATFTNDVGQVVTWDGANPLNDPMTYKEIEVIGNNFTLLNSKIDTPQAGQTDSVYISDFQYNTVTNTPHVKTYAITGNLFGQNVSLKIASGAGNNDPADLAARTITDNTFGGITDTTASAPAVIDFRGANDGLPWEVLSVGGATITGNTFSNSADYIRAAGTYDNTQFDWKAFFNSNTYTQVAAAATDAAFADLVTYSYSYTKTTAYTSINVQVPNVRHLGDSIMTEVNRNASGEFVYATGTFTENVTLANGVALRPAGGGLTIIGTLTVNNNGTVDFDALVSSLTIFVTGDLTLNAGSNLDFINFAPGHYTLFSTNGSLTGTFSTLVKPAGQVKYFPNGPPPHEIRLKV